MTGAQSETLWAGHATDWRDPLEVVSLAQNSARIDPKLFKSEIRGAWWDVLAELGISLFVTREYEHLILAHSVLDGVPRTSFYPLPHPSGMAYDPDEGNLFIASTRNPNQVFSFRPVTDCLDRLDIKTENLDSVIEASPMLPARTVFLPGCTYLHDLAMVGPDLCANAVGHNAVIRIDDDGSYHRIWWPDCIEKESGPDFGQNYLQLNSIAAGVDIASAYFSASTDRISARRPGHKNFKVDRQGVIFSGATREPIARGLTRPHSARIHQDRIWVDNSGYGELGYVEDGDYVPFVKLPGWTRGLLMIENIAFVGTSRVLPRFHHYAPGLDVGASLCGVHVVDLESAETIGSIIWPFGNQIFSFAAVPTTVSSGFPSPVGRRRATRREQDLYYCFA